MQQQRLATATGSNTTLALVVVDDRLLMRRHQKIKITVSLALVEFLQRFTTDFNFLAGVSQDSPLRGSDVSELSYTRVWVITVCTAATRVPSSLSRANSTAS